MRIENCTAGGIKIKPVPITQSIMELLLSLKGNVHLESIELTRFNCTDLETTNILIDFLASLPALKKIEIESCKLSSDFEEKLKELMGSGLTHEVGTHYQCLRESNQQVKSRSLR